MLQALDHVVMLKSLSFLLLFASCSLFRVEPTLDTMDKQKLLEAVKVTGEGRGRLNLGESHYVFGVDSVLNEHKDWILAVQIPLHGEEVMIMNNLRRESFPNEERETFELRMTNEFKKLGLDKKMGSDEFLYEIRSLLRFVLSPELGLERNCVPQKEVLFCHQDGHRYRVRTEKKLFFIEKILKQNYVLQIVAKNLTNTFFSQTNIMIDFSSSEKGQSPSSFSMEFFW